MGRNKCEIRSKNKVPPFSNEEKERKERVRIPKGSSQRKYEKKQKKKLKIENNEGKSMRSCMDWD